MKKLILAVMAIALFSCEQSYAVRTMNTENIKKKETSQKVSYVAKYGQSKVYCTKSKEVDELLCFESQGEKIKHISDPQKALEIYKRLESQYKQESSII